MSPARITVRNARFQQWEALLENRSKRQRLREFLVQGVRPIEYAVDRGHPVRALLHRTALSSWGRSILDRAEGVPAYELAPELLRDLGERSSDAEIPELVVVAELPPDDLGRISIPSGDAGLVVVFDRPVSPGNIGTLVRSADAFGAHGVVITGHAADAYDPKAVRASTGSLFALPIVRVETPGEVVVWAQQHGLGIVGTDENGTVDIASCDLTGPTLLLVGNETRGLSRTWREACDVLASLPMPGARVAGSLNAAAAGTVALYETDRQRR